MNKQTSLKVSRTGAYVVRAAESPSARVPTKSARPSPSPSARDTSLARAVIRHKSSN